MTSKWKWTLAVMLVAVMAITAGLLTRTTKATAAPSRPPYVQVVIPQMNSALDVSGVSLATSAQINSADNRATGSMDPENPLVLTMPWSTATPLLYKMMVGADNADLLHVNFYGWYPHLVLNSKTKTWTGGYAIYYSIVLDHAFISSIKEAAPQGGSMQPQYVVSFAYQKITWTSFSAPNTTAHSVIWFPSKND